MQHKVPTTVGILCCTTDLATETVDNSQQKAENKAASPDSKGDGYNALRMVDRYWNSSGSLCCYVGHAE